MKGKNSYKTWLLDQNNFQGSIPIKQIKSAIKKKKDTIARVKRGYLLGNTENHMKAIIQK